MDIPRTRRITRIVLMASAVLALVGLIIYLQGSTLPGVLLLIIGIAVAMICSTMLKFMSWYDYPWLLNGKGKRERSQSR